jgi:plasmid stabilization system protein ParE
MTYLLHRDAERELEAAFQFYKNKASMRVAQRFLDEFERVASMVDESPEIGTRTNSDRRTFPFRTFPYSIIYKSINADVKILVVRHDRRSPDFGKNRV